MSNTTDDPNALWAKLQAIQVEERKDLERQKVELEQEKETMGGVHAEPTDIVEINAGGTIITTHRATLCLASDSMFAHLFSGRWDDSWATDSSGRIFLDHDPELVQLIVNHLRIKRIEDPSKGVGPPKCPENKKKEFRCMLKYFGLEKSFFRQASMDFTEMTIFQPQGNTETVFNQSSTELSMTFNGYRHHFVAVQPPTVQGNNILYWKVHIDVLLQNGWLYLGLIGDSSADSSSYSNATSFGWGGSGDVYYRGKGQRDPGWTDFVQSESLFFRYNGETLSMYSDKKGKAFTMGNVHLPNVFLHFNFHERSSKISVSNMSDEEREILEYN
jgi:BTB/POZ domain